MNGFGLSPPMTSSPHDALFRFTFSQPEHAAPLIRSNLPTELARRIDWSTLALQSGSFVDPELGFRHTDLLFSAMLDGRGALLYLLVEHQSTPDPLMPLRLLRYVVRIWDDWLKRHDEPGATKLPAVVPIVVYHGKTKWTAPVRLGELIDLDVEAMRAIGDHLPELRIFVDDWVRQDDAALRARAFTHAGELTARSLARLPGHPAPMALLGSWGLMMRKLGQSRSGYDALVAVMSYALAVTDVAPEALKRTMALHAGQPGEEAAMTAAERIAEEARKAAMAAVEEARKQGRAEIVLKLLSLRFGPLPESAVQRIQSASIAELDTFAERVLGAKSLDEVFG